MLVLNLINVCAQYEQTGRNADKIPHHTCKVNYVRMVLHCALHRLHGYSGKQHKADDIFSFNSSLFSN